MLRDPKVARFGPENLAELAAADQGPELADLRRGRPDPRHQQRPRSSATPTRSCSSTRWASTDPSHAFYLGYELMKAKTALTLSKTYRQDQALDWGFLTEPEVSHRDAQARQAHAERGRRRDPRRHRHDRSSPDGVLNIAPMGPEVEPRPASGSSSGRTGRRPPTEPEGTRRRRAARHRRRAPARPGGDRRAGRRAPTRPADGRARPDPGRRLPLLRVPRRRARRPRRPDDDRGRDGRRGPASATSSASTGPSTRWSRRRSWPRGVVPSPRRDPRRVRAARSAGREDRRPRRDARRSPC